MLIQIGAASLDQLIEISDNLFSVVSGLLGGIFGLYLILVIVRIIYSRKMIRELKQIKHHVAHISRTLENENRKKRV